MSLRDVALAAIQNVYYRWHYVTPEYRKHIRPGERGYGWTEEEWQHYSRESSELRDYLNALHHAGIALVHYRDLLDCQYALDQLPDVSWAGVKERVTEDLEDFQNTGREQD